MSTDAINIYNTQLTYQMGAESPITATAVYDPENTAVAIYGTFDNVAYRSTTTDPAGQSRKSSYKLFVSASGNDINIYEDSKKMTIGETDYTIQFIDKDETGVNKFWLK